MSQNRKSTIIKNTFVRRENSILLGHSLELTAPQPSIILTFVRAGPARQSLPNPARVERQQRYGSVSGCRRSPARASFYEIKSLDNHHSCTAGRCRRWACLWVEN